MSIVGWPEAGGSKCASPPGFEGKSVTLIPTDICCRCSLCPQGSRSRFAGGWRGERSNLLPVCDRGFGQAERAAAGQRDAAERRAQELFSKSIEQLGHDKAAVRIGALHALDALGQEHEHRRRAVMDVWCAYLRMPPSMPDSPAKIPNKGKKSKRTLADIESAAAAWPAEELQVRFTAQRLIADCLRDPNADTKGDTDALALEGFWEPKDIDLSGVHLHRVNLRYCLLGSARFHDSTFYGDVNFEGATFHGNVEFLLTTFLRGALA